MADTIQLYKKCPLCEMAREHLGLAEITACVDCGATGYVAHSRERAPENHFVLDLIFDHLVDQLGLRVGGEPEVGLSPDRVDFRCPTTGLRYEVIVREIAGRSQGDVDRIRADIEPGEG